MRTRRKESTSNIYHIIARGTGRQVIFEDDSDRGRFLEILDKALGLYGVTLYAWCLMSNHVHLLMNGDMDDISLCMKRLCGTYAQEFNQRAGRVGHLFQERFKSEPVETDTYLFAVVRYIHDNPVKANLSTMQEYPWSSYKEYLSEPVHCSTSFVLEAFGGRKSFVLFHENEANAKKCLDVELPYSRSRTKAMPDTEAREIAARILGTIGLEDLKSLSKHERNDHLHRLKSEGLSIRQIERLTGIGRNIVATA